MPPPEALRRFREPLEGRRGFRWVHETYARHRQLAPGRAAARLRA
jgi:hypothetical protein